MILFITHEKDFFAKQCYLMLKYQRGVPTRWMTWAMFLKQPQHHTLHGSDLFNPILPAKQQIKVLYINLMDWLKEAKLKDQCYEHSSWISFLMWYVQHIPVVVNPIHHELFSPGFLNAKRVRRIAQQLALCQTGDEGILNLPTPYETYTFIGGELIHPIEPMVVESFGHERIQACLHLLNALKLEWAQLMFDQTHHLRRIIPGIKQTQHVAIISAAVKWMQQKLCHEGLCFKEVLHYGEGQSIDASLRPNV